MPPEQHEKLTAELNRETARIDWRELERHFARGAVVTVDPDLDLIQVAAHMAQDDQAAVQAWLTQDRMRRTTSAEALRWSQGEAVLWSVVVAPWVLVQEEGGE